MKSPQLHRRTRTSTHDCEINKRKREEGKRKVPRGVFGGGEKKNKDFRSASRTFRSDIVKKLLPFIPCLLPLHATRTLHPYHQSTPLPLSIHNNAQARFTTTPTPLTTKTPPNLRRSRSRRLSSRRLLGRGLGRALGLLGRRRRRCRLLGLGRGLLLLHGGGRLGGPLGYAPRGRLGGDGGFFDDGGGLFF